MRKHFYTKDILINTPYQCNVGEYTYSIGKPEVLYWGGHASLTIGKFCSIALGLKIFLGGDHMNHWVTTYPFSHLLDDWPEQDLSILKLKDSKLDSVEIKNDVWIGNSVTILPGVTIGDGCSIGTGSIVSKDVPPYHVVAGNPAKIIKQRFSDEIIEKLLQIQWWNWEYNKIMKYIPYLCSENIQQFISLCDY